MVGGYAYILSMGESGVRVKNTYSFFCADHGLSMDRNWRGSTPQPSRARPAIKRYRPDIIRVLTSPSPHTILLSCVWFFCPPYGDTGRRSYDRPLIICWLFAGSDVHPLDILILLTVLCKLSQVIGYDGYLVVCELITQQL